MLRKLFWVLAALSVVGFVVAKKEHRRAADEAALWAEATDPLPERR